MSECIERFLRYVGIDTQSSDTSDTSPSTMKQHDLASILAKELEEAGVADVVYDREHCYVYGRIPANNGDLLPEGARPYVLGLIAHMDTSPDVTGAHVRARIVTGYDGGDIVLNEAEGIVLSPRDFPLLAEQTGNDLVVTDGTTLLGADDKAGVSEIMTMVHHLLSHPEIRHGEIRIGFTPDEEIGEGTAYFDIDAFAADGAFTVDGGKLGELEYENFNAAEAQVIVHGRNVHPGTAKGQMINATLIAYEFHGMLPVFQNPMYTEKREGFYHLNQMRGTVDRAVMHYILRDHDLDLLNEKKHMMESVTAFLNDKYGAGTVELLQKDVYYNMIEKIRPHMHLVENATKAMEEAGVEAVVKPIRGGTDGAKLSYMGLPCPNLCTGGYNYHGRFEYASVQEMEKTVEILTKIAARYGTYFIDRNGAVQTL